MILESDQLISGGIVTYLDTGMRPPTLPKLTLESTVRLESWHGETGSHVHDSPNEWAANLNRSQYKLACRIAALRAVAGNLGSSCIMWGSYGEA